MPLPWDTDFFGFPIGRVQLEGVDAASLERVEADARRAGIVCLYGALDPVDAPATFLVQARGWRLVEVATMFDLATDEPAIPRPDGAEFRLGNVDDIPSIEPLSSLMAPWSRYAVDPRFGLDAATRLQAAWLDRAARAVSGQHSLVVAEVEGEIVAFIGRVHEPRRVDAVGTSRRGSGAARYLIQTAREWAGDRPLLGGPIAARNIASLRYVSHCGYRPCQVEYLYHRWLDEE